MKKSHCLVVVPLCALFLMLFTDTIPLRFFGRAAYSGMILNILCVSNRLAYMVSGLDIHYINQLCP